MTYLDLKSHKIIPSYSYQEKEERQTYFVVRRTDAETIEIVTALRLKGETVSASVISSVAKRIIVAKRWTYILK